MDLRNFKCRSCGQTGDWAEGSEEDYASATARIRNVDPDADGPDQVIVCRGCGVRRIVLTTTFNRDACADRTR
jgi:hypothetical protein